MRQLEFLSPAIQFKNQILVIFQLFVQADHKYNDPNSRYVNNS